MAPIKEITDPHEDPDETPEESPPELPIEGYVDERLIELTNEHDSLQPDQPISSSVDAPCEELLEQQGWADVLKNLDQAGKDLLMSTTSVQQGRDLNPLLSNGNSERFAEDFAVFEEHTKAVLSNEEDTIDGFDLNNISPDPSLMAEISRELENNGGYADVCLAVRNHSKDITQDDIPVAALLKRTFDKALENGGSFADVLQLVNDQDTSANSLSDPELELVEAMDNEQLIDCLMYRCDEDNCADFNCQKGRIMVEHVQKWLTSDMLAPPDDFDVKLAAWSRKVLNAVIEHAKGCDEDPSLCSVPWCFFCNHNNVIHLDSLNLRLELKRVTTQEELRASSDTRVDNDSPTALFYKLDEAVKWPSEYEEQVRPGVPRNGIDYQQHGFSEFSMTSSEQCALAISLSSSSPLYIHLTKKWMMDENVSNSLWRAMRGLRHPSIVRHLWAAADDRWLYVCRELAGPRLSHVLRGRHSQPVDGGHQVLRYAFDILSALDYLHGNEILFLNWIGSAFTVSDAGLVVKLTDFSRAVSVESLEDEEDVDMIVASLPPHILPPEVSDGNRLSYATDVWGFGCILYYMAEGRPIHYDLRHSSREQILNTIKDERFNASSQISEVSDLAIRELLTEIFTPVAQRPSSAELLGKFERH